MSTDALQEAMQRNKTDSRTRTLIAQRNRSLLVFIMAVAAWFAIVQLWVDRPSVENTSADFVIDLNSATEAELNLLPGVGTKLAQEILRYRDEHGGFRSVEDLTKIKGIKGARTASLRRYLTVAPGKADVTQDSINHDEP